MKYKLPGFCAQRGETKTNHYFCFSRDGGGHNQEKITNLRGQTETALRELKPKKIYLDMTTTERIEHSVQDSSPLFSEGQDWKLAFVEVFTNFSWDARFALFLKERLGFLL